MSSSRDTSRDAEIREWRNEWADVIDRRHVIDDNGDPRLVEMTVLRSGLSAVHELLAELDLLRQAYHHACAEVARWRAWYGFADFGLTEVPDEQVQDVQEEFLVKARGVGA